MPRNKREAPRKTYKAEPWEAAALGLPLRSLVISPASAQPSKKAKNANKEPKPNSKKASE